jgi:dihydroneopterin aldolase
MSEHEMVLGSGLLVQGRPALPGTARAWPRGFVHAYRNPSDIEQTVLCVDRPSFLESDEVAAEVDVLEDIESVAHYAFEPG